MDCRYRKLAGLVVLTAAMLFYGCRGDRSTNDVSAQQNDSGSETIPGERDSAVAATDPILSAEPAAPIVENPETEASGNASIGHCDVRDTDNLCIDFTGSAWNDGNARSECSNAPGSAFRTETCPSGNRIGTCVIHPNGDASLEMVHSFYEPMDPILAEGICPGRFEAQ